MAFIKASISDRLLLQLPSCSLACAVLLMILPFDVVDIVRFFPLLDIILLYYWAIYRPDTLSLWFLFLLGIILDIFYAMPLGITSFTYLMLYVLVNSKRKLLSNEPYMILWGVAALLILSVLLVKWIFAMAVFGQYLSLYYIGIQWIISSMLCPLLWYIACALYKVIPEGDSHA